jgi:hypothetical protein
MAKARSGKNRDKPYYKEKALETCVLGMFRECDQSGGPDRGI